MDFILELRPYANLRSVDPADFSDIRGDIYNRWHFQGIATGSAPVDVINTCEENEKAITTAYEKALGEESSLGRTCANYLQSN